jgi:hypothetical protein
MKSSTCMSYKCNFVSKNDNYNFSLICSFVCHSANYSWIFLNFESYHEGHIWKVFQVSDHLSQALWSYRPLISRKAPLHYISNFRPIFSWSLRWDTYLHVLLMIYEQSWPDVQGWDTEKHQKCQKCDFLCFCSCRRMLCVSWASYMIHILQIYI